MITEATRPHMGTNVSAKPFSLEECFASMLLSREADRREGILFRQGRAKFQLPSAGHESMAAMAFALNSEDVVYAYYRDRALMLARGTPLAQIALDFFSKAAASSGGRQMASHFFDPDRNVASCATPTGLQCLPAVGTAWGLKLNNAKSIVLCCIGEAATRQGEFYEAVCFALQERLPIVFLVEDNGYGISTPTAGLNPYNLDILAKINITHVDGRCPEALFEVASMVIEDARWRHRPSILWVEVDRLMSHTSSDDQRIYRSKDELAKAEERDPLSLAATKLSTSKIISNEKIVTLREQVREKVDNIYEIAGRAEEPDPATLKQHLFAEVFPTKSPYQLSHEYAGNFAKAVNWTLRQILAANPKAIMLGEDICDPKGGVFSLTKGLSSQFPKQVYNSPLAEATICGVASGLCLTGHLPIFELQFIDFVGPAFNQIVNQIATLRWRTMGHHKCPLIILAPSGAYLGCGGPWHSQTNEAWFIHSPGLKVAMPSNAVDAADIIGAASVGQDPILILLPKSLFFCEHTVSTTIPLHSEQARMHRPGRDVTLVAWGNTVHRSLEASQLLQNDGIECEILDLKFLSPFDLDSIKASVKKTGRLLVIQEDNRSCSLGQAILTEIISDHEIWQLLKAPPALISREDVPVAYNACLESNCLPQAEQIITTIKNMLEAS